MQIHFVPTPNIQDFSVQVLSPFLDWTTTTSSLALYLLPMVSINIQVTAFWYYIFSSILANFFFLNYEFNSETSSRKYKNIVPCTQLIRSALGVPVLYNWQKEPQLTDWLNEYTLLNTCCARRIMYSAHAFPGVQCTYSSLAVPGVQCTQHLLFQEYNVLNTCCSRSTMHS